jgi:hypothetical protein
MGIIRAHSFLLAIIISFSIYSFSSGISIVSAQDNTMYFMHSIPQSIHTNPALFYRCRTYIELPVLSGIGLSYSNSGFGYHDALHYGTGRQSDSLIIDINNLDKNLKKRNYIRTDLDLNLLGAGFRVGEYYVHFNISNFTRARVGIPGDLVSLKDGNWDLSTGEPRNLNLSGLGVTAQNYFQIAAGASTEIWDGLYAGATVKYLRGTANLESRRTDLIVYTEGDPIALQAESDYRLRASFPMEVSLDNQGIIEGIDFANSFSSIMSDFILNGNHGAAVDLGVIYEYTEDLTLSASIVDLGFIRWKSNANRFDANASVRFTGFDLRQYISTQGSTDFFEAVVDSVMESFQFQANTDPYTTFLTTKIFAGAQYQVIPKLNVSAVSRTELFDRRPHFSMTLAGNYSPWPFLRGTLSYTLSNYKYDQLGFGLAVGGRGAQFYFVTDHIPIRYVRDAGSGIIWPYNARLFNFRFGVNLMFGCDEQEDRGRPGSSKRSRSRSQKLCPAYD